MKKHHRFTCGLLIVAMLLAILLTVSDVYNIPATFAMPGYTELTGGLKFGATTVSGSQGRTVVNNHPYIAAVFGTGGWSSNGSYTFNNVDYRAAFDSASGDWLPGDSYFDGAKLGYAGVEFITPQVVTSIAYIGRKGYSTNRLEGAYFQGSNDGVNYTTLFVIDQVRSYGYPYGMSYRTMADGLVANRAYKYFRVIGNSGMPDVFNIAELKLYTGSDTGSGNAGYRLTPPSGPDISGKFNNVKNSAYDPYYSNVILLNEDRIYQCGAAWAFDTLDLTKPFTMEAYVYMYHSVNNNAKTMADGMTFTLQNDKRGLNAFSQPGGTMGEALGVYGRAWVQNALSIELDTKISTINKATNDECVTDPTCYGAHISVVTPAAKVLSCDHKNPAKFTHTNKWYEFKVSWTPSGSGGKLNYTFDNKSYCYTVTNTVKQFGGTKVYWGFTGATGEETQINAVAFKTIPNQKPQMRTVTYYPNNGSPTNPVPIEVPLNSYYTIAGPTLTRDGFSFKGWNTRADGSGTPYMNGQSIYVTEDINLYAQWEIIPIIKYGLYYDANGGTDAPAPQIDIPENTTVYISAEEPKRTSYNFLGWSLSPNSTAPQYLPGNPINIESSNITLYAVWAMKTPYILFYYANGGTGAPPPVTGIPADTYITISDITPSREGYDFLGWAKAASTTVPEYQPGDSILMDDNYALYALWGRQGRTVIGYVAPMATEKAENFLKLHDIVVELRTTFRTPAPAELSTLAVLQPDGLGKFTFENVPYGTYVLYIKRPGFLARAMMVTISATDPPIVELAPPNSPYFDIWYGDCNDDGRVDNEDVLMVIELAALSAHYDHPLYNPACDLNADGFIDEKDVALIMQMWGRIIRDYPGAENVDFFI